MLVGARYASSIVRELNMTDAIERMGSWNWSRKAEVAFRVLEKRPIYEGEGIVVFNDTDRDQLEDISVMHVRVHIRSIMFPAHYYYNLMIDKGRVELQMQKTEMS